jgi:hypothetical protein
MKLFDRQNNISSILEIRKLRHIDVKRLVQTGGVAQVIEPFA